MSIGQLQAQRLIQRREVWGPGSQDDGVDDEPELVDQSPSDERCGQGWRYRR